MVFCSECGYENGDDATFCASCGSKLIKETESNSFNTISSSLEKEQLQYYKKKNSDKKVKDILGGIVWLFMLIVFLIILYIWTKAPFL